MDAISMSERTRRKFPPPKKVRLVPSLTSVEALQQPSHCLHRVSHLINPVSPNTETTACIRQDADT
jgi:hypothetical protein